MNLLYFVSGVLVKVVNNINNIFTCDLGQGLWETNFETAICLWERDWLVITATQPEGVNKIKLSKEGWGDIEESKSGHLYGDVKTPGLWQWAHNEINRWYFIKLYS